MNNHMYFHSAGFGAGHEWLMPFWLGALLPVVLLLVLWSVFWKGLALWHSARHGQYWWFAILLVVNTAGILEIIYLLFVVKLRLSELFSTKTHLEHHSHHTHSHPHSQ